VYDDDIRAIAELCDHGKPIDALRFIMRRMKWPLAQAKRYLDGFIDGKYRKISETK
jgi:hypothetical protein